MKIQSKFKEYEIVFEKELDFIEKFSLIDNSQFVIDKNVYEIYKEYFQFINPERLIVIEATEQNKVIDTALNICEKITEIAAKRNTTLISIGGGIIQDITGFVANITYRGIKWIFVPTTLLSACDSCIGGKTSLNYKKYKNLLGTFYPPDKICICSKLFQSLTEKDFKSGLGEVVKFNIMEGENGLNNIENNIDLLLTKNPEAIDRFVQTSLNYKKDFIEIDEFDKGERIKLNFAHTFGHAIEVISDYVIPHGTSVAIGMIMANKISYDRQLISDDILRRSEKVLLKVIDIDEKILNQPIDEYLKAIRKDKKQISDSLTAVLISEYGEKGELSIVHNIKVEEIRKAISYFLSIYVGKYED